MLIQLDKKFKKKVRGMFGKYEFEVGVLKDGPHYLPKRGVRGLKGKDVMGTYAGGPIRKRSRKTSGLSISDVSKENRERMGVNYLTEPFEDRSKDIIKFTNEFFKLVFGGSQKKRCENLLQAIVRNPILQKEYGSNAPLTKKIKGFNRKLIDTAQLFRAIVARCRTKSNV